MISVIIPTLNSAQTLTETFACLISPTVSGLVREVIVSDGGSTDETAAIAEAAGATVIHGEKGRGGQLRRGAAEAKGPFLLFLHSDTQLETGWEREVGPLVERTLAGDAMRGIPQQGRFGAAFRFQLDDHTARARILERIVACRCVVLKLPYGDQGLLITKEFYDELGGFGNVALMEDIDLTRRIGRRHMVMLRSAAVTSARRYRSDGYFVRIMKNSLIVTLWLARVPTSVLVRLYG